MVVALFLMMSVGTKILEDWERIERIGKELEGFGRLREDSGKTGKIRQDSGRPGRTGKHLKGIWKDL